MTCTRAILCLVFCIGAALPWPARALDRTQLAVIVNTRDPLSVEIGEYYAKRRQISFQNIIKVGFPPGRTTLTSKEFGAIKAWVDEQTMPRVQAYALTWAAPYRVECMSITSAFAFGFDPAFCAEGCKPTRPSRYFNSRARLPFTQLGMRPTMAIAATSFEQAKALIDRGVASDRSRPTGVAALVCMGRALASGGQMLGSLVDVSRSDPPVLGLRIGFSRRLDGLGRARGEPRDPPLRWPSCRDARGRRRRSLGGGLARRDGR